MCHRPHCLPHPSFPFSSHLCREVCFPGPRSPSHPLATLPCGFWITFSLPLTHEPLQGRKHSCFIHQHCVGIPSDTRAQNILFWCQVLGRCIINISLGNRHPQTLAACGRLGGGGGLSKETDSGTLAAWEPAWSLMDSESHSSRMLLRKEEGLRGTTVSSAPLPQVRPHRCCPDYLSK